MKHKRTAFMTFFPIKPDNMGSSAVINSRYKSWPSKKKIFQLSHLKKINNKNIETFFIKKENPYNKIISLPCIINKVYKYLKKGKENVLIIEGASWIFYSFCALIFFKIFLPSIKIIYISHSVEYEIRKKYSNIFIYSLTFLLEFLVFHFADISTSVSKLERNKIFKLYKKNTYIYPNGIILKDKIGKRIIKENYIIFSGSYFYKPNKVAINFLNEEIMPILTKEFPRIRLILTGGGYKKNHTWLVNKEIVKKEILHNLVSFSNCMCVPLEFGSGTRIKIIEALMLGCIVLSTKKGIEGINTIKKNPPFVASKKKFLNLLTYILKNQSKLRVISNKRKKYYKEIYSMEKITKKFIEEVSLKF